jgi:hypothetical protein
VSRKRVWWTFPAAEPRAEASRLRPLSSNAPADEIRHDLVARVRREIAAGVYDTPEKWDAALERLSARLG